MQLNDAVGTLENCRFCLMCSHVAPVGQVTKQETLTPHGVALTVTSQQRGLIDWNEETVSVVFSEVDGGNSRMHCVNDQPFEEAVATVRAELVQKGLGPTAVSSLRQKLERYQSPFAEELPRPATGEGEVALFIGDEAPYLWEATIPAVLKLLNKLGVDPVMVGIGRSNGFIAQSAGLPETAAILLKATLSEIEATRANKLMVLSAGDFFVYSQMMRERLDMQPNQDHLEISEIITCLADELRQGNITFQQASDETPYAYIDPTHAVRLPERHEKVRALVTAVMPTPPRELFFRKERAHPVGSTQLQFSQPKLADQLTRARLQDAQQVGAKLLICEDPATLFQVSRFAGDYGLKVRGLYELLAENIL